MQFLAVVGTLAVSASAFLIVPELPEVKIDSINTIPPAGIAGLIRTINLECPGCHVGVAHGHKVASHLESHLEMVFTVDLKDNSRLLLNGIEIYPHPDLSKPLEALHVIDRPTRKGLMRGGMMHSGGHGKLLASLDVLGFSLFSTATGAHPQHVTIDVQVFKVRNMAVDTIPTMHVNLIKHHDGRLAITEINTSGPEGVAAHANSVAEEKPNCDSWLCKLIGSLESHWNHWRPHCGMSPKSRPHHHSHHGKGPHQRPDQTVVSELRTSHRAWRHVMSSVGSHIILSVLMVGFTMSMIGMMIGALIIFAHRRVVRSPWYLRYTVDREAVAAEEKDGLMEHQESPPSYEEAPTRAENADTKL